MIKKLLLITSVIIGAILTACGGDSKDDTPKQPATNAKIVVAPTSLTADCQAQTLTLNVNSDGDWNVTTNIDWCKVTPSGGLKNQATDVKVTLTENKGIDIRTGFVTIKSGTTKVEVPITQNPAEILNLPFEERQLSQEAQTITVKVEANCAWSATSSASWLKVNPASGNGSADVSVQLEENPNKSSREGDITFNYAKTSKTLHIVQLSEIPVPEGYSLVWSDEFNNDEAAITNNWTYDVQAPGWVNNEKQRYVAGSRNGVKVTEIHDGMLTITASKEGGEVISGRLNSRKGWTYGIFEARIRLPKGKGTWPAFWMYPLKPNGGWPYCGEIDIMEEVGCVPNEVSSSIHCQSYNHVKGTQKTAARTLKNPPAEGEFHIYRLEWTEDYIKTYVDGQQLFYFPNDKKGNRDTWPFNYDFKIILNLAWGGDWGGMWGVDESALPVKYDIDYVRVYQK